MTLADKAMQEILWNVHATSVVHLSPHDVTEEESWLFHSWMQRSVADESEYSDSEEAADDDGPSSCALFFASASAVTTSLPAETPDHQIRSRQPPIYRTPETYDLRDVWPSWRPFLVRCVTIIASYTDQESAPVADDTDAEVKAFLSLKFLDWHTLPETFDSAPAGRLHEVHQQLRAETAWNWELRAA